MLRCLIYLAVLLTAACGPDEPAQTGEPADFARSGLRYLGPGANDADFVRALEPRAFSFPTDHGPHRGYRSEWWYFTGNLDASDGRRFGFQLTFFRFALAPGAERLGRSAWRARDVWMAHFTITDERGERFFAHERLAREAIGVAGASDEPMRIWVKDWSMEGSPGESGMAWRLTAGQESLGLELELTSAAPPVSNGDRGLDPKGPEPGNASYYYSMPRLAAAGRITIDGQSVAVEGLAWLDREWSTSALSPGIVGWDWFALQLDDGRSLMVYRLRGATGETSPFSGGTLVGTDGMSSRLSATDATIEVLRKWTSPRSGKTYPVQWRLRVPSVSVELSIDAVVDGQELDLSVRYWEGAVDVEGTGAAGALTGRGYVELTGY